MINNSHPETDQSRRNQTWHQKVNSLLMMQITHLYSCMEKGCLQYPDSLCHYSLADVDTRSVVSQTRNFIFIVNNQQSTISKKNIRAGMQATVAKDIE